MITFDEAFELFDTKVPFPTSWGIIKAEIERLKAENEKLKAEREGNIEKALDHNEEECKRCMEKVEIKQNLLIEEIEERVRKETAEEIFERLKPQTHQGVDMGGFFVEIRLHMHDLIWLEAKYGVKV